MSYKTCTQQSAEHAIQGRGKNLKMDKGEIFNLVLVYQVGGLH